MQCPACQSDVPGDNRYCGECGASLETPTIAGASNAEVAPSPRHRRAWPVVVAIVGALLVGITAGVAIGTAVQLEPNVLTDPWYAFVDDEEWRATPEEALAVAADERYKGAEYWYLVVGEDTDEVDYLLGADGRTWEYRVEVLGWEGRWYAWGADPSALDLEPVAVSGEAL